MSKQNNQMKTELRQSVAESFSIYQGTVTMISIFLGFVFLGLLQVLAEDRSMDQLVIYEIRSLVAALLALSLALFSFHAVAHQVVRFWGIFLPASKYRTAGTWAFNIGIISIFCCIALLLWNKGLRLETGLLVIWGLGLICFGIYFRSMHGNASYVKRVD